MLRDRGLLITATNQYRDGVETLVAMLESLRQNDPEQQVRVYLYNFDPDVQECITKINPNAQAISMRHDWPDAEVKLRMACVRTELLQLTVKKEADSYKNQEVMLWTNNTDHIRRRRAGISLVMERWVGPNHRL